MLESRAVAQAKPFERNRLRGEMDADIAAELLALQVPKVTLGLHHLYDPPCSAFEIAADIVAVHGLGGDSYSTWTDQHSGKLWLRDFLPQHPEFKNVRIMTFGYDARVFVAPGGHATTGRIFTFGESLLSSLTDSRIGKAARNRPLIFVGHSLGGLVIKSALVYAQSRQTIFGDVYQSTKAIIFFGTPHAGADAAVWATYLGNISKAIGIRRTKLTTELQRWSNPLVELGTLFCEQIPDLLITTFFEMKSVHGVLVVPEASARLGQRTEVAQGLDADHRTMCKFATSEVSTYKTVVAKFNATLAAIAEQKEYGSSLPSVPTSEPSSSNPQEAELDNDRFSALGGR